jgi:hypothetical protein
MEIFYKGNYVFAEDTSGLKPAEIKKILKARDKTYFGSRMHFIRTVLTNELEKNKFWYSYSNLNYSATNFIFYNIYNASKEKLLNTTFIKNFNGRNYFSPRPCMGIVYNSVDRSEVTFQSGEIMFKRRADEAPLTPNSYNESYLQWSGKMAEQRVCDLLPFDFEPSEPL